MLISKKLRWKNLRSFWNLYDFLIILVNYKPHKIRLYRLFVCYKCVTKNHFYLFLNSYRHFLCSSIISTCLLCFSYSACNSALRKAIYSTVEVNPCSLNLLILFLYAPASTISNFSNNSRFALPIRNRRSPFSFIWRILSIVTPCSLATAAIVRLFMNISLIILFSLLLVKCSTMPHNWLLECSAYILSIVSSSRLKSACMVSESVKL